MGCRRASKFFLSRTEPHLTSLRFELEFKGGPDLLLDLRSLVHVVQPLVEIPAGIALICPVHWFGPHSVKASAHCYGDWHPRKFAPGLALDTAEECEGWILWRAADHQIETVSLFSVYRK